MIPDPLCWHPYSSHPTKNQSLEVTRTEQNYIYLKDGTKLIDSMSSWWSAIWGYNHPHIIKAMKKQLDIMPHIMFGGLTHEPAIKLSSMLVKLTKMDNCFFVDSGSVAIEVAMKTAYLYHYSQGRTKTKFLALKNSYHGDTFGAMSICDPINSMHSMYNGYIKENIFVTSPKYYENKEDIKDLEDKVFANHKDIAAIVIEPLLQGAGGMKIYRKSYIKKVRELCDRFNILLIADEIATGFGHTGEMFAMDKADVKADILCIGKSLTSGHISLACMLSTDKVAQTISNGKSGALMHGPTFMANPLALSAAIATIELFEKYPWQNMVQNIENTFNKRLKPLESLYIVKEVRVLGNIGAIELQRDDLANYIQSECVKNGVWLRPFGNLLYTIPPYITPQDSLEKIAGTIKKVLENIKNDFK